jgi:hypothetical protein
LLFRLQSNDAPLKEISAPSSLRRVAPWLGLAGLGALWFGARALNARALSAATLVSLVAGLAAWTASAAWNPPERDRLGALDPPAGRPRGLLLVLAIVAAGMAAWRMPAEEFRAGGVAAWLGAIALWLAAWWPKRNAEAGGRKARSDGRPAAAAGILLVVIAIAGWFLFRALSAVPANPVSDHAEEMLDLLDLLDGRAGVYFFRNLGIAPFHFYWTAAFLKVLGLPVRYLWVKAATAAFGLLLIPALYLAGAELGGAGLGLAAAAFAAWGKWPVSLSRQGQEYEYAIPFAAFVLWALLRWQRRGDRGSMLLAGVAIGLGLTTYTPFRVVPLLVPLAVAVALLDSRRRGRRLAVIGHGGLAAFTSALVFLPVLKFALVGEHREFFWARILTRTTGAEQALEDRPLVLFGRNLLHMAQAFHWKGASTWTVLTQYDPFLDAVTGALLLGGGVLALRLAFTGGWRWAWLFPALFVLTLPSTLALAYPDENPSLNRAETAAPVVFLGVGLAYAYLWRGIWRERIALRAAGAAALLAAAAVSIRDNAVDYFVRLGRSYDAVIDHALEVAAVLGDYRKKGIPLSQQYLLGTAFWIDARNVALELGAPGWVDAHNVPPPQVPALAERPLVFVYRPNELARIEELHRLYPDGTERLYPQSNPDRNFGVYYVP